MKSKLLFYYSFLLLILVNCSGSKNSHTINQSIPLSKVELYRECSDPVEVFDTPDEDNSKINLRSLSYSTTYTAIYTHHINADSLEKDSIRFAYAKSTRNLVKMAFPKIALTDDAILLRRDYKYIVKNLNNIYFDNTLNKSVENLTTEAYTANMQLFINVSSSLGKNKFPNRVCFYIFNINNNELKYRDCFTYNCDIRDYTALEKVISHGLLKLKEYTN